MNCEVTGVTISKVQYEYVKSNVPIEIIYSDLHDYNPNDRFDVCLFIESFCHLENPLKVLYNIRDCSNKIILREYHLKSDDYPKKYVDSWLMNIYKKDEMISLFDKIGFKLTFDENHYDYSLEPTLNYWLDNLKKIDNSEKTHHINTLEFSARYLKKNLNQVLNDIGLSTFIFEKC